MENVYKLYSRLEDNFEGIRQKFRDYVIENGMEIIKNKRAELENLKKNENKFNNDTKVEKNLKTSNFKIFNKYIKIGPKIHYFHDLVQR